METENRCGMCGVNLQEPYEVFYKTSKRYKMLCWHCHVYYYCKHCDGEQSKCYIETPHHRYQFYSGDVEVEFNPFLNRNIADVIPERYKYCNKTHKNPYYTLPFETLAVINENKTIVIYHLDGLKTNIDLIKQEYTLIELEKHENVKKALDSYYLTCFHNTPKYIQYALFLLYNEIKKVIAEESSKS